MSVTGQGQLLASSCPSRDTFTYGFQLCFGLLNQLILGRMGIAHQIVDAPSVLSIFWDGIGEDAHLPSGSFGYGFSGKEPTRTSTVHRCLGVVDTFALGHHGFPISGRHA